MLAGSRKPKPIRNKQNPFVLFFTSKCVVHGFLTLADGIKRMINSAFLVLFRGMIDFPVKCVRGHIFVREQDLAGGKGRMLL